MDRIITLNKAEQIMAMSIAIDRTNNARGNNITDAKMGDQSGWLTDLEGIAGEIAAARYFNAYPDTTIRLDLPPYDLITNKGKTADIKTTKYKSGKLIATLSKSVEDCDIYVLVIGEFPTYEIVGWVNSSDLIMDENIGDLGHGSGYMLEQSQINLIW